MEEKILNDVERRNAVDMLNGCINRICVTNDIGEIFKLLRASNHYLYDLAFSRFLQLKERENVK